ncbi:hypothetical protein NQ315_003955 [Exocentrus adspersus]|uniref:Major facilitator superfamily (MFS) profile domain-containing protein n=1 Tax=Exocentrus adspersus TaxID=1586481 RepID=A0AAV8VA69_9CUCU|nr:hypothetical protein NQ315_003955 [Exocentrus adspersus]
MDSKTACSSSNFSRAFGFPNNLETYGLISGLWTSAFALGAFIGPSISGILYDNVGFNNASMFIVTIHLLVGLAVTLFVFFSRNQPTYVEIKNEKVASGENTYVKSQHQSSTTESMKSIRSVGNGISIEKSRPPGMNSLIACNSYKSQAWPKRDTSSLNLSPYSYSYGTVNHQNDNHSTSYLQGVA